MNWIIGKWLLLALAINLAAGGLTYAYIVTIKADRDLYKTERDAAEGKAKRCETGKQTTKEYADALEDQLVSLRKSVSAARNVRPRCVLPAGATIEYDDPAGSGQRIRTHGIRSEWLLDIGAECEGYRLQLQTCQNFIKDIWANY